MEFIDLRSDTVTRPTTEMREAMAEADVGDDVYGEDNTVKKLEERISKMFDKEAALFLPSGTMSNLIAILSWCQGRGSEVIVGDKSHIFLYEQTGACQFGGVSMRNVPNLNDGTINIDDIRNAIRDNDIHEPETKLICIENTHNACGGKILPIDFMHRIKNLSISHKIPIHMDGARLWNALTVLQKKPQDIGYFVDSLTVCLSKGLGCPVGSLLVGSKDFITKARRIRKALGGGMRQSGVLAAAGLIGLDDFEKGILEQDHKRTKELVLAMENMYAFRVHENIETNIIFVDILLWDKLENKWDKIWNKEMISTTITGMIKEKGVCVSAWAHLLLRIVVHRDIDDEGIQKTITALQEVSEYLVEMYG